MPKVKPMKGLRFGRLTVLDDGIILPSRGRKYSCLCDCGIEVTIHGGNLRTGASKSCGCLRREVNKLNDSNLKHGMSHTSEYQIWINMRRRCNNPKNDAYEDYGGRGIIVCKEWNASFEAFYKDMGPRPSEKHTLDRIETNGNYEKSNCRWATWEEQQNNRRNNRPLKVNGIKYGSVYQLARAFNIPIGTLKDRIFKMKLSPEDAVVKSFKKHVATYRGETKTIAQWARIYNISYNKLRYHLTNGLPFEYAILVK